MGDSATFQLDIHQFIHIVWEAEAERLFTMAEKNANITCLQKGKGGRLGSYRTITWPGAWSQTQNLKKMADHSVKHFLKSCLYGAKITTSF